MKTFCYAFAMMLVVAFAGPALADKSFDICINPATDVVLDDLAPPGFSAGDGFVGVAIIVPGGDDPDRWNWGRLRLQHNRGRADRHVLRERAHC